jgi:hypothetical protein
MARNEVLCAANFTNGALYVRFGLKVSGEGSTEL